MYESRCDMKFDVPSIVIDKLFNNGYEEQIVDAENQLETEKKNFNEIKVNINQQINQLSNLNNELQKPVIPQ